MNKERLLQLAEVLESKQAENHFYMGQFLMSLDPRIQIMEIGYDNFGPNGYPLLKSIEETMNSCNTAACVAGWAVAKWNPKYKGGMTMTEEAAKILDLDMETANQLFIPDASLHCGEDDDEFDDYVDLMDKVEELSNPKLAAKVVRHLAETGVVDWTKAFEDEEA